MKYPKEYLDEIKARLKVSNVVSRSVSLKKRGKEFVGLSPFKNEKTPSFTVNDEKGFYHCFSTGEHGNIFDFLMKTQNLKFGEAVKFLSNYAGMQPYTFSKADEERENKRKIYLEIYSEYTNYFHTHLLSNIQKLTHVRDYLRKRKISSDVAKNFKIGYADQNLNIFEILKKNFSEKSIIESGIFYNDDKKKIYLDRFRNRLIFPINDISGNPIAIGGRSINDNGYYAKYINSPETLFFKKGSLLYNLDKARKYSNKKDQIFLVEGYMDVVGLDRVGIENAVANLGTALTDKQILILNQFFNHIVICFDADDSGYNAAIRAAENSLKELQPNKKISFLFLPEKEDPDSFVTKNGKDAFLKYSQENLIPIHKLILDHYKKDIDNTPSSFAIFEKKLKNISNLIKDKYIKKYVLEYFLEKISEFTPYSKNKGIKRISKVQTLNKTKKIYKESLTISLTEIKEFSFLYLLLENPTLIKEKFDIIKNVKIYTKENNFIFTEIIKTYKANEFEDLKKINIDKQLIDRVYKFSPIKIIVEKNAGNLEYLESLLEEIVRDLKNIELELRIQELESKFSKDFNENTFNELTELKKLQKIN
mgnify:CR=1 FL=1|tara:strand:+ start:250 stop:2025 length:1776 start_codon:yes stop_codon:yes gene_type:complete